MKGMSMGNISFISEGAAASPGAARKSMECLGVRVEEEEVFQRIQKQNSTINTSNTDTAKSKNYNCSQLLPLKIKVIRYVRLCLNLN